MVVYEYTYKSKLFKIAWIYSHFSSKPCHDEVGSPSLESITSPSSIFAVSVSSSVLSSWLLGLYLVYIPSYYYWSIYPSCCLV